MIIGIDEARVIKRGGTSKQLKLIEPQKVAVYYYPKILLENQQDFQIWIIH